MMYKLKFGTAGEDFAVATLRNMGYEIIDRNYRTKFGEIDIVATKDEVFHFVEVKTRMGHRYGHAAEAVNNDKQQRMKRCALLYLEDKKIRNGNICIDVFATEVDFLRNCV